MWQCYCSDHIAYYLGYINTEYVFFFKPGPDLFTTDWLSKQNHAGNKHKEIAGMKISTDAISTTTVRHTFLSIQYIQEATHNDTIKMHLKGWPLNRNEVTQDI